MQSNVTLAESFTWKEFLQPVHYCWSWRTQRQPGSFKDLNSRLQWLCGRSEAQRPRPRHALPLACIGLPSPSHFRKNSWMFWEKLHIACLAVRCKGMGDELMWEKGSSEAKRNVEFGQQPNLDYFYMTICTCVCRGGDSDAVELTQQLCTQRLARFPPSPLVCSVSLPAPHHSHPGANNLYQEIRRTPPRNWLEADSGGTTTEVLRPESIGSLGKTCLSVKHQSLELWSGGNSTYGFL